MQESDHSIVRAVLAGDKEAYGALVRAHSATVFRVAFRIIGNEAEAEEIVQEAFLRGYQRLESLRAAFRLRDLDLPDRCELRTESDQPAGHSGRVPAWRGERSGGENGAGGHAGRRSGAGAAEPGNQCGAETLRCSG